MRCEEAVLLRVFVREDDLYRGKPLYKVITQVCHERGIAGVTVFKGVLGFGKSLTLHEEKVLRFRSDAPIVVEIIDCEDKVESLLKDNAELFQDALVTMEKVKVVRYN